MWLMPARILVIEDDDSTARALKRLIETIEGVTVHTAATLAEARRRIEEPWDCVLMDMQLPDGWAVSLLRRLRHPLHSKRPPRVAVVSGSLHVVLPHKLETLGADAVFPKPVVAEVLV